MLPRYSPKLTMNWYFVFLDALLLTITINGETFGGYKVYHIVPQTNDQVSFISQLQSKPKFDFWKEGTTLGDASDVMVAPELQEKFESDLSRNGIDFEIVIEDVEGLIQQDRRDMLLSRAKRTALLGEVTFRSFMTYNEQVAYVRRVAEDYPNIATLERLGESYEGRDILILHVSSGKSATAIPKPVIFIDAGIHCREWIAPPVALYIIQQLVENPLNAYLYENVDWYIVPNLNPDGYEYTQSHNRLWRKNRRLTEGAACYGTDLNRNFGYMWMFAGATNNSCTETFAGPEEFSEPETRALRDWFLAHPEENVKLYLTFHSYGEMVLYPWGYDSILPDNFQDLHYAGQLAATAIDQSSAMNSRYRVNSSAILLSPAAGGSDDWVKAIGGVDLAYCIELPDGDAPFYFMIPARQILPVVQETFEGVKAFHGYIKDTYWDGIENESKISWRND
ncbi:carboxypeptidase B-like [Euwallacea fornicatus]|uniref:carboxypeptidase B-like n=1 Tax=Euwallacea fornicatus TaxID=995702 RepID=UPI00338EEF69